MNDKDSALFRANRTELKRLTTKAVSYMEITKDAGAFSCGACRFARKNAYCEHDKVKAPVSAKHGCCNLFWPRRGKPVFDSTVVRKSLR